jgi:hypothetical protein
MYNIYGPALLARPYLTIPQPERVAMMSHRILPAALLLCTLAACGQSPTGSDVHVQPGGPSYGGGSNTSTQSGGYTIGSVNEEDTGGYGMGSGNSMEEAGGYGMGSGNLVAGGFGIGSGSQTADTGEDGAPPVTEQIVERSGGYGMGSGN